MIDLDHLEETLRVKFDNREILRQALIHRSFLNETEMTDAASNERMEFLGDALLNFVIAERLYIEYPGLPEGDLTHLRSSLVRTETLARIARDLGLGEYLYLSKGEDEGGGRYRPRNLAGTLEAIIGAVLIDRGFQQARDLVLRVLGQELEAPAENRLLKDPKSHLQEVIQARDRVTPAYRTVDMEGPEHQRTFTVEVLSGETLLGRGAGPSKRAAEQEAARAALIEIERGEDVVQYIQEIQGKPGEGPGKDETEPGENS